MSLTGKRLNIIDTCDLLVVDKTTGKTMFTGFSTKSELDQKADTIDIYAGIGQTRQSVFRTKKVISVKGTLTDFNLDFLASMNGVALDSTSTGTYFINKSTSVTTGSATVTGATRVMAVRRTTGEFLTLVSTTPANATEVEVSDDTLTFYTGFADTSVLVTYEGAKTTGKDNLTLVFNGKAFPANAELIMNTVVYDGDTEAIVADCYINLYKVAIDPNFTWALTMGQNTTTDITFEVLAPKYLPDGTVNDKFDLGKMVITER